MPWAMGHAEKCTVSKLRSAAPHGLEERDQKGGEMCLSIWSKTRLGLDLSGLWPCTLSLAALKDLLWKKAWTLSIN